MQTIKKTSLKLPTKLPKPTGYRMILVMPEIQEKTAGGIIIPEQRQKDEIAAGVVAYVAAQGDDCYTGDEFKSRWCEVGDWVVIAKYAGAKLKVEGVEVRFVNDNGILGTVEDPDLVQRGEL